MDQASFIDFYYQDTKAITNDADPDIKIEKEYSDDQLSYNFFKAVTNTLK
jgi:hypothetical protein